MFQLRGNLDFLDFLQKKFYNINYRLRNGTIEIATINRALDGCDHDNFCNKMYSLIRSSVTMYMPACLLYLPTYLPTYLPR